MIILTSIASFVLNDVVKRIPSLKERNNLLFINTPAEGEGGDQQWLKDDRESFKKAGFKVSEYSITGKKENELRKDLVSFDIVYVSGGNTFYFLEKAQESGFANLVKELVLNDKKIYMGTSAGSVVAGPNTYPVINLDDVSIAPNIKGYQGFSLVDFVVLPHWGSEKFKKDYLDKGMDVIYETKNKIILLRDSQYILIENNQFNIFDVEE